MEISIDNKFLTIHFAGDQVVLTEDEIDIHPILRKLKESHENCGFTSNTTKTEYIKIVGQGHDSHSDTERIKKCESSEY